MKYIARCEFGGSVFDKYVIEADDRIKAQAILEAKCEEHGLNVTHFWLLEVEHGKD